MLPKEERVVKELKNTMDAVGLKFPVSYKFVM